MSFYDNRLKTIKLLNIKDRKQFYKIRLKNKKNKIMYHVKLKITEKFKNIYKFHQNPLIYKYLRYIPIF